MEYDDLPMAIRTMYSRSEWAWLPDIEKYRAVDQTVEPDYEDESSHAA